MPIVPFTRRDPSDDLDESLRPSHTHLMMAAATIRELGLAERAQEPEKPSVGRLKDYEARMEVRQRYSDWQREEYGDFTYGEPRPQEVKAK